MDKRSLKTFIYILDDDSLLNIFHFCRPVMFNEDETGIDRILEAKEWDGERWWYKLVHVCRRWRYLILMSASHLGLSLLCTYGTPVADMLAHSPPLPLIIDYLVKRDITGEDEEGIMLALRHHDRVCRIRLRMPFMKLRKLITAVREEFPMLEYLGIGPLTKNSSGLILPNTFRAPHLRHLILINFAFPTGASLLPMAGAGLVTLLLADIPSSPYFFPDNFLQQLSILSQLEILVIGFRSPVPNRDVERQLLHRPIMAPVILPNLRWFGFKGVSAYLEAILPCMTTPLLEGFRTIWFHQLDFSIPQLLQFIGAAKNLRFSSAWAKLRFFQVLLDIGVYHHDGAAKPAFSMQILWGHLDRQVASAVQVFHALRTVFSAVEYLSLEFSEYPTSSATDNETDRTQWRELLCSFTNVQTLRVDADFRGQISRSLQVDEGESAMELLPELKVLEYPASDIRENPFHAFIDARKNAGRPITLVHP
jgi:hypothetical protein